MSHKEATVVLQNIKTYIYKVRGKVPPQVREHIVGVAIEAYTIMGVRNPQVCGRSYVHGTICNGL